MVALPFQTDHHWTVSDLEELPEDGNRYELLQGELIVSPAPGKPHQRINGLLYVWLLAAATRANSGEVVNAPANVRLSPSDLVQPDVLYLRESQAEQYGDVYIDGAPAFVIEIASPSSANYDRIRKASLYMDYGVEEYWVVEPKERRILIHRTGQQIPSPITVTSGTVSSSVLPEFSVDLDELFAAADHPVRLES